MSNPLRLLHAAAGLALAVALSAPAHAESRVGRVAEDVGLGLASATCTALYLPVKVFVASTGALVGLTAWGITGGQREPALDVLEATGGGDWLITDNHLRGDQRLYVFAPENQERDDYADRR